MSRLPAPEGGWEESTEGDLDPDLTEEEASSLEDWDRPFEQRPLAGLAMRIVGAAVLVAILASSLAVAVLR